VRGIGGLGDGETRGLQRVQYLIDETKAVGTQGRRSGEHARAVSARLEHASEVQSEGMLRFGGFRKELEMTTSTAHWPTVRTAGVSRWIPLSAVAGPAGRSRCSGGVARWWASWETSR